MLKAIIFAALFGMLFPAAGHALSRSLGSSWLRFAVSLLFLVISILLTYALAVIFNW
jgi:hypothetical protein